MQLDRALDASGAESPTAVDAGVRQQPASRPGFAARSTSRFLKYRATRRQRLSQDRRDPVRLRTPSSVGRGRAAGRSTDRHLLITKGAPEAILARRDCLSKARATSRRLSDADQRSARSNGTRAAERRRAFACWPSRIDGCAIDRSYSRADEVDLVLAGFLSFADPVLPDVADVLGAARSGRRHREDPHRRQRSGRPPRLPAHRSRRPRNRDRRRDRAPRRRRAGPRRRTRPRSSRASRRRRRIGSSWR